MMLAAAFVLYLLLTGLVLVFMKGAQVSTPTQERK